MATLTIYGLSVLALAYALVQTWRYADRLRLPRVVIVCLMAALLLYLAGVVPATLKVLTAPVAGGLLIALSALTSWVLHHARRPAAPDPSLGTDPPAPDDPRPPWAAGPWHAVDVALCLAATVLMSPLLEFVRGLKGTVTHPGVQLPWDTVSYHLPVLIETVQHRSLWGLQGAFSSYALGFEFIAGYPALFFWTHASLVLANAYALLFLQAALVLLSGLLARAVNRCAAGRVNALATALMAVALWCVVYPNQPKMIGKNDVFLGAVVLATLGLLIESGSAADPARSRALLCFAAMSMGLAAATKATALLYAPFFGLFVLASTPREQPDSGATRAGRWVARALVRVSVFTAVSAAIGGIWYIRNLIEIGHLVAPEHARYFRLSIFHTLSSGQLHYASRSAVFSALAATTPLMMIGLTCVLQRRGTGGAGGLMPLRAFTAFLATAFAVYIMTPLVVLQEITWQLRLGMPFFAAAAVAAALAVAWVGGWRLWRTYPAALALAAAVSAAAIALPSRWAQKVKPGLPHFEVVRDLPPTSVYKWVATSFDQPVRIYAAGLRPYGVAGTRWQNPVFADLHSHLLFDDDVRRGHEGLLHDLAAGARAHSIVGKPRLFAILKSFRPDLVIVAVEIDEDWPPEKPLVVWMRQQPFFEQVYDDDCATAFRVKEGWQHLAAQFPPPPDKPLRMGP